MRLTVNNPATMPALIIFDEGRNVNEKMGNFFTLSEKYTERNISQGAVRPSKKA